MSSSSINYLKKPKPNVSNWFSSLKRQGKSKKVSDKLTPKSCVDLTANSLYENSDEAALEKNNTSISCCCECLKATSPTPSATSSSSASVTTATITKVSRTIKSDCKYEKLPSTLDDCSVPKINVIKQKLCKKEEILSSSTTTTITKTTVINKQKTFRVGLVFSDTGELLSGNLDLKRLFQKNNPNLLYDDCNDSDNDSNVMKELNNNSENNKRTFNKQFSILDDSNFEYIDDSFSNDIYNRNYHANSTNSTPIIIKKCNNCKNRINLDYKRSLSSPQNIKNEQIKDELCEVVSEMEAHDSKEDSKHSNKDKQMTIGRKKFNMDPKKGIEFLYENHLLRMDPQDVAQFLYKGEGLNKTAIGDYLGEKNDFNEQVLKAFVELHDFTNLILVQALRQFLWSFRLPGEAQKIDRMMECFAQRYCYLNTDIFTNTDTCYVLSFAIIMLNTSLHNPSVKDKPTVEQFISMNRGINNGGDLPRELLESLYESIRTEPFKIPQDDGNDLMHTFFNPDKEGWLWKQGGRYKSWKRRWFILNDNCLYYFEYTTDKEPRGIIPLENISIREIADRNKPHCFEIYASGGADIIKACKTDSEGKVVEGKHTVYRMSAATEEEQQEWITCLTQSISHNPFHDILVQRKKKALAKKYVIQIFHWLTCFMFKKHSRRKISVTMYSIRSSRTPDPEEQLPLTKVVDS